MVESHLIPKSEAKQIFISNTEIRLDELSIINELCDKSSLYLTPHEKFLLLKFILNVIRFSYISIPNNPNSKYKFEFSYTYQKDEIFDLFHKAISQLTGGKIHSNFLNAKNVWEISI